MRRPETFVEVSNDLRLTWDGLDCTNGSIVPSLLCKIIHPPFPPFDKGGRGDFPKEKL